MSTTSASLARMEEGKKLKLGDVRLYPLLFEFNGKKCQAQRLLRRGKIRKQDQQSLTPYFFRDRETRKLVFHWLTTRVYKKTESSMEEGGDAEKITVLLNSYGLQKIFLNKENLFRRIKTLELAAEQFTFGVEAAQVSTIVDYHDYYGGEVCWWLKDKIKKT